MNPIKKYVSDRIENGFQDEYCKIPEYMHDGIRRWILDGILPGSFLEAVIRNDFKGACVNADENNSRYLANYGKFFTWYAPMGCWGCNENVKDWKGLNETEQTPVD